MSKPQSKKWAFFAGLIAMTLVWRLLPHPPGLAPILALSLFLGSAAPTAISVLMVLGCQAAADAWIGVDVTWPAVYLSLVLSIVLGAASRSLTQSQKNWVVCVPALSIVNSLIFFVLTNAAVWALTTMYPHTLAGLELSYVAGLPFLKNSIAGDLALSMLFFSIWHYLVLPKSIPARQAT